MTILPIAERELRVAARRRGTYRVRWMAASAALAVSSWIFLVSQHNTPTAALSLNLFRALSTLAFFYTLVAGIRVTADCLSEEKRDGTLGLLFLTDLRGYDVVLGKLAATSMNSIYGLLAIMPVLAIPLLMGGLSMATVGKVFLTLMNTLFFSLSAGMLVSSLSKNERRAAGSTLLLVLFFTAGMPMLGALYMEYLQRFSYSYYDGQIILPFLSFSPGFAFGMAMESSGIGQRSFWESVAVVHLLGWLFLAMACRITPRTWQDKPASIRFLRWRERWERWGYGHALARRNLRAYLLDINAFLWLSERNRLQRSCLYGFYALLGVGFFWGYVTWRDDWLTSPVAFMTAIVLHCTIKLWVVAESSRRFMDLRRDNVLELILSTAITVKEILRGQRLAFYRLFGVVMGITLAVDCFMIWIALKDTNDPEDRNIIISVFLVGIVFLVIDFFALIWVSTWQGLSAKNVKKSGTATIGRLLTLPWVIWFMTVNLVVVFADPNNTFIRSPFTAIIWWMMIGLAVDCFYGWQAYKRLYSEFRVIALQRYQPPQPGWLVRIIRQLWSKPEPSDSAIPLKTS